MNDVTGCTQCTERTAGNRRASNLLTVLVMAADGQPLNPCHPARARELIRKQRALRICRHPYTIRLLPPGADEAETAHSQQVSS